MIEKQKNRKKVIFEPESQNLLQKSPNFNQRVYKDLIPLTKQFRFSLDELLLLKQQFDKSSVKGLMKIESFRESLGLFGLENAPYLSNRIYSIIDQDHDGTVDFVDYLKYLDILLNGTETEKSMQSFQIFDYNSNGILGYEDIEKMLLEICLLWNVMTGEKVTPTQQYLASLFSFFDHDHDGTISMKDYRNTYTHHDLAMFGWYEFLNNGAEDKEFTPLIKVTSSSLIKYKLDEPDSMRNSKKNSEKSSNSILDFDLISGMEAQILEMIEICQKEQSRIEAMAMLGKEDPDCLKGPILDLFKHKGLDGENNDEVFPEEDISDPNVYKSEDLNECRSMASFGSFINQEPINPKSWDVEFLDAAIDRLLNLGRQAELLKKSIGGIGKNAILRAVLKENEIRRNSERKTNEDDENAYQTIRHKTQKNIPSLSNIPKTAIRKSLSIYFGHPNWNLVLNMMIGIRASVHKKYRWNNVAIEDQDFKIKLELDLIDKRGAEFDKTKASKFYDYCPRVFEAIRKKYGITNEIYLRSVGPEQLLGDILMGNLSSLTQFCSSGKSGSLFYYSFDGKFILKTISNMEFIFFKKILKDYYDHLMNNEDSLLIRVFGLHKIKLHKTKTKFKKIYIIIMQNLLNTDLRLDIKYDLKGSFYGRTSRSQNVYWDKTIPLKDLDFLEDEMRIFLNEQDKKSLIEALEKDCQFFIKHDIIDYSILIAIHFIPQSQKNSSLKLNSSKIGNKSFADKCQIGLLSGDQNKIYIIGVIDILTNYSLRKKVEYNFKKTLLGNTISCIPPKDYASRFFSFLKEYIVERNGA